MPGVAVRERGITFSTPLVPGVMDGTKTQMRRIVEPQPKPISPNGCPIREVVPSLLINRGDLFDVRYEIDNPAAIKCPYGAPGDLIYVKETWAPRFGPDGEDDPNPRYVKYRADTDAKSPHDPDDWHSWPDRWRSGRYMPKWAARTWLELTGVRVERLAKITEEDAIAEGIESASCAARPGKRVWCDYLIPRDPFEWYADPIRSFRSLWDSVNGKREGCDWNSNPWVFVISFRRIEREGG